MSSYRIEIEEGGVRTRDQEHVFGDIPGAWRSAQTTVATMLADNTREDFKAKAVVARIFDAEDTQVLSVHGGLDTVFG